jgi:hypothetical protein
MDEEISNDNRKEERDIFSQMMFGAWKKAQEEQKPASDAFRQKQELPLVQLMNQVDEIYTSIQDLKPVIREFSPIINFLKKKIKV